MHDLLLNGDWGEPEGRQNSTEVFISILESAQKHRKVNYTDLTNRQTMHVPREICHVSYRKATLLQDSRCAFHKVPFCAKMSVAMKPLVCKDVQKAAVSL